MARPKPNITIFDRLEEYTFYSPDGCWYWLGCCIYKYGSIYYNNRNERVHRVSYRVRVGDIPKGLHVLHRCDNPLCINPDHLFLGTNDDNVKDKVSKNRQWKDGKGEAHPRARLTNVDILAIRSYQGNLSSTVVSRMFGTAVSNVCLIWQRKAWKHI